MYMTSIAALVSTLVMSSPVAEVMPLSCVPAGVTRAAGFRLDLNSGTFARPIVHPNAVETGPGDINNDGQIVGAYREQSGQEHAFRLNGPDFDHPEAGSGPELGTLFTDIDAKGTVLGNYDDPRNVCHSFLLTAKGNLTAVEPFGDVPTQANGRNETGQTVGAYQDQDGRTHGFLQDDGATRTIDIDKPGVTGTVVTDINDAGEMVGIYGVGNQVHGFRMDGTAVTFLDDVAGATATVPLAINDGGDVVGTYLGGTGQHGFVILDGTLTTRDDIVAAYGVNDRREVVGIFQ
jgi:probable HAF family extracellular repeat protein